jgi:hypothetical protein
MNCTDAHLASGAEPHAASPDLEQHLRECASCADYRREMLELDENIRRALKLDLAALKSDASARPQVRLVQDAPLLAANSSLQTVGRHWALAASMLFAVAVVFVLWGALPRHSLAADVVAHVISEPWLAGAEGHVPPSTLAGVLERSNLRLDPMPGEVMFAQTCFFRGRLVPHFVVRTHRGPVTVLILPNEHVKTPERFAESGYSGILLPDEGRGSIAVLSRAQLDAEKPAREILSALHSKPQA